MKLKWKKKKEDKEETAFCQDAEVQKKERTPAEKKKRRKRIITGVIAACLAVLIAVRAFTPKAPPQVTVQNVQTGTIEQTVNVSGTVKTEQMITCFSPLSARVSECRVAEGDAVEAGEVLLLYDSEDLKGQEEEARLQNEEAYYNYQNVIGKSNADAAEYSRSSHDIGILEQQVKDWKEKVRATKQYITDMGYFLRDAQKEGNEDAAQEYQSDIDRASNRLAVFQDELAEFESNLAEQKSIRSSSESTMLTASGKKQIEATKELAALKAQKVSASVASVTEGVKAQFRGVVTSVKAVEGSRVEEGSELLTIESSEDVCVETALSKSDLEKVKEGQKAALTVAGREYEGTVSWISKSATKNEKGAAVVAARVHIDNPDPALFLGVESKVKIEGEKVENAALIPIEAVNVGKDGSFVYVVKDGRIEKRSVALGISSAEQVEVTKGLNGSEQIVLEGGAGLEEGAQVTAVEG